MTDEGLKHFTFTIISDTLDHTAPTVPLLIGKLIAKVKEIVVDVQKIKYFSDGAGSQYKNF